MNIKDSIRQYIRSEILFDNDQEDLSDAFQLIENGIIDSRGIMKLVGFLEDEFSVEIDELELMPDNFASVEAISNLVEGKLK